jgi:hypothetical protein
VHQVCFSLNDYIKMDSPQNIKERICVWHIILENLKCIPLLHINISRTAWIRLEYMKIYHGKYVGHIQWMHIVNKVMNSEFHTMKNSWPAEHHKLTKQDQDQVSCCLYNSSIWLLHTSYETNQPDNQNWNNNLVTHEGSLLLA